MILAWFTLMSIKSSAGTTMTSASHGGESSEISKDGGLLSMIECMMCDGQEHVYQGILGRFAYFRCRACGWIQRMHEDDVDWYVDDVGVDWSQADA